MRFIGLKKMFTRFVDAKKIHLYNRSRKIGDLIVFLKFLAPCESSTSPVIFPGMYNDLIMARYTFSCLFFFIPIYRSIKKLLELEVL